jgi:hypothetical protein
MPAKRASYRSTHAVRTTHHVLPAPSVLCRGSLTNTAHQISSIAETVATTDFYRNSQLTELGYKAPPAIAHDRQQTPRGSSQFCGRSRVCRAKSGITCGLQRSGLYVLAV